jgi:peptidoglycan hydrolase CwlO-like protein
MAVKRFVPFFVALVALALVFAGIAWADTPVIDQAKSQAEALRAQIDELDAKVEEAAEDYNTATANLEQTKEAAEDNEKRLALAEVDLDQTQGKLTERVVQIYKEGHLGLIDTLVGSETFSDLINRLNLLERLSKQDRALVEQVTTYRDEVTRRKAELKQQIADQTTYKGQAAAAEKNVEAQLAAKEKALKGKEV